jgi:hypothetical protein
MNFQTYKWLADLLAEAGLPAWAEPSEKIHKPKWPKELAQQLQEVYEELQGKGDWRQISLEIPEGIVIANRRLLIDDALHFNRYRAISLRADFYELLDAFPLANWRRYCRSEESACLKNGRLRERWTNPQAEQHFGTPAEPGDFTESGSPAWRMRAFQDALIDAAHVAGIQHVLRVSVHDRLLAEGQLQPLGKLLQSRQAERQALLQTFLLRRLGQQPEQKNKEV